MQLCLLPGHALFSAACRMLFSAACIGYLMTLFMQFPGLQSCDVYIWSTLSC